jgi:segregation and condensation protein A
MSRAEGLQAEPGAFEVDLPVWTGPFRALAEAILGQKVDVCDVSIARVVETFIARSKDEAGGWTLEEATWFVATCATLLELKVNRLLPRHVEPDEEDLLGTSPDLLYARRLELAAFRQATRDVARRLEEGSRYFGRDIGPGEEFAHLYPDIMAKVTPEQLAAAAADILRPPPLVDLSHVAPIRASVSEALAWIVEAMQHRGASRFRELVADCAEPIYVVVRFLALLQLHNEGRVALRQAETFGEIEVEWEDA